MMKAIVQDRYGGHAEDVLRLTEIERPAVGDDEVLLRVHAAGVDRGVWHIMAGLPYPLRLAFGLRAPTKRIPGMDVAGVVEATGKNVAGFRPGDEVFGIGQGTYADYTCAREDKLAPKPANLSFAQAAAVPISALTALQGLRDHARVRPGQKVLILGASGGVGSFAVQIARAFGTEVTGVCGTTKVDLVRSLGAAYVVDYTREDIGEAGQRYDVILDTGGHRSLTQLRRAVTRRGTLVVVGSETGGRWLGGFDRSLRAPLLSLVVSQKLTMLASFENARDLLVLVELIDSGAVAPTIDRTFPLGETAKAITYLEEGHVRGKVVITV
jgi:NADPH:quinone reductase-like Zn-dependent oxidoreductase